MFILDKKSKGNATIELALSATVLAVLTVGATDFGRSFQRLLVIADAVHSTVNYGTIRIANSGRTSTMTTMTQESLSDINSAGSSSILVDRYCDCPGDPATGPTHAKAVNCFTATCGSYGTPRVYVRVRAAQNFSTIGKYPYIPQTSALGLTAYRRAQ